MKLGKWEAKYVKFCVAKVPEKYDWTAFLFGGVVVFLVAPWFIPNLDIKWVENVVLEYVLIVTVVSVGSAGVIKKLALRIEELEGNKS